MMAMVFCLDESESYRNLRLYLSTGYGVSSGIRHEVKFVNVSVTIYMILIQIETKK